MSSNKDIVDFKLIGAKEVEKALKELPTKLQANAMLQFNKDAANQVVRKKLQAARGKYKKSVKTTTKRGEPTTVFSGITMSAFWLRFTEFGTKVRKTKGRSRVANKQSGGKVRAGLNRGSLSITRPFVEATVDSSIKETIEFANKEYGNSVNKFLERRLKSVNKKLGIV